MADTTALPWLALRPQRTESRPTPQVAAARCPMGPEPHVGGARWQDTFVNLGARDGLGDDPLQFLVREERFVAEALAVEMDPERLGGVA